MITAGDRPALAPAFTAVSVGRPSSSARASSSSTSGASMAGSSSAIAAAVRCSGGAASSSASTRCHVVGDNGCSLLNSEGVDVQGQVARCNKTPAGGDAAKKFKRVVSMRSSEVCGAQNGARIRPRLRGSCSRGGQLNGCSVVDGVVERSVERPCTYRKRRGSGDF